MSTGKIDKKAERRNNMTINERAVAYSKEMYGTEEAFKFIAAQGYKRGAEDERKILVERVWRYLAKRLQVTILGNDGMVVLQGGIIEEEFRKMMMED